MTGLDCLYEELKKRGLSEACCKAKAVPVVLDILANTGTAYSDLAEAREEYSRLQGAILTERNELQYLRANYNALKAKAQQIRDENHIELQWRLKKIEDLKDELLQPETTEAKDRLRLAKFFVESVEVNTKYDNTAFIKGLASILGTGKNEGEDDG